MKQNSGASETKGADGPTDAATEALRADALERRFEAHARFPRFRVTATVEQGQAVVVAAGELDLASARELASAFEWLDQMSPARTLLDLRMLVFIDVCSLHLICEQARKAQQARRGFRLAGARGEVARLLEITGAQQRLRSPDSRAP